jgi:GNAT superfamily N-acetyltransferase
MTVSVRPVRYESESRELVDTLQANLPHLPHARLFPWLYLQNPEGRALAWVATDSETDRIVGVAAAFPRRIYCHGEEKRSYVLGDFCIDAHHRSLGLALTLQRACLGSLSDEGVGFAFDFPSLTMLAVYKRLKIDVNATMVRHAKPLRADRKLAEHIPVRAVARGLSVVANAGLRLRDNGARSEGDWKIAAEPGPWGEEFTQTAMEWSPRTGVCVARTAAYLNWRYREHPLQNYEMLTARLRSRLCGYLIYSANGDNCTVDDLFAGEDAVRSAMLAEVTRIARERGAHTVSVPWLATHPGRQLLEECGFRPRESSPVILLALPRVTPRQSGPAPEEWYLTHGDWES